MKTSETDGHSGNEFLLSVCASSPAASRAPELPPRLDLVFLEDDPNDRALIQYAFRDSRADLRFFSDMTSLREDLHSRIQGRRRVPDSLLLDIYVPRGNGLRLLAWVRDQPRLASVPRVVVTGSLLPTDLSEARRLGADAIFEKDLSFRPLVALVFGLVKRRRTKLGRFAGLRCNTAPKGAIASPSPSQLHWSM